MMMTTATVTTDSEKGMTLIAVMAMMTLFAVALLAVAPSVQQQVQREKELEEIRRGEEVAYAIQQYVEFYRGSKLPNSLDDLLEGLPQGTKKRQILRPSAAIDPLSADGKWRLIKADPQIIARLAKRVQAFNNGILPSNPSRAFDRYVIGFVNTVIEPGTESDIYEPDDDYEVVTDNTPFIGVASQSRSRSVVTYYGLENHSKWIFTPLFRGASRNAYAPRGPQQQPQVPQGPQPEFPIGPVPLPTTPNQ
jgi:type II secretory pathway pseudopilin PulG